MYVYIYWYVNIILRKDYCYELPITKTKISSEQRVVRTYVICPLNAPFYLFFDEYLKIIFYI